MLLDAEQREDGWLKDITFDVCICGAGPAGITLARKLGAKGWTVGLFESGGLDLNADAQELAVGRNIGQDYFPLESVRIRAFGGTSGHWEGFTRPLDAHDFEPRTFHATSGWPIRKADLDPFADEVAEILDLAPSDFSIRGEEVADVFSGGAHSLVPTPYRASKPPTRFGTKFRAELTESRVYVCLNSTLVDIELDSGLSFVTALSFRSFQREGRFTVRTRYAVLCLGGIENPRFLLNANRQIAVGIGNQYDVVGRYFCEHPSFKTGSAVMRGSQYTSVLYAPSQRTIDARKCLNFAMEMGPASREPIWRRWSRQAVCSTSFSQQLVSKVMGRPVNCFDVFIWGYHEQALNWDCRVLLADETDRFGQRRAALDWRLTELDFHTMRTAITEFGRAVAETNVGRVQIAEWLHAAKPTLPRVGEDKIGGIHHMCTTRMSDDPRRGVVDSNCRVHLVENLYVAGSSVFATAGYATPTYTIVQLALRLAQHLDARLRR